MCVFSQPFLVFRKDIGRGSQHVIGLYEVKAEGFRRRHLGQQSRRLGSEVDLHLHALGSRQEWQAALWNRSQRDQYH